MANLIVKIISFGFTTYGVYLIIIGDLTNGLLSVIVGELTDMPKNK